MAFDSTYFASAGANSKPGKAPQLWTYKTADTAATIDSAGYFNGGVAYGGVYGLLRIGDWIMVTVVTNLGASNEAFSDSSLLIVKDKASGTVDVIDEVANFATTDTD